MRGIQAPPFCILIPNPGGLRGLKLLPCNDDPLSDGQSLAGGKGGVGSLKSVGLHTPLQLTSFSSPASQPAFSDRA